MPHENWVELRPVYRGSYVPIPLVLILMDGLPLYLIVPTPAIAPLRLSVTHNFKVLAPEVSTYAFFTSYLKASIFPAPDNSILRFAALPSYTVIFPAPSRLIASNSGKYMLIVNSVGLKLIFDFTLMCNSFPRTVVIRLSCKLLSVVTITLYSLSG